MAFTFFNVFILLGSFTSTTQANQNDCDVRVRAGQSIQAAINSAHRGDRILVEAGTYAEQLTINKDSISLIGRGAILVPPANPVQNLCSGLAGDGTQAGICVAGSGVVLAPFVSEHRKVTSVDRPVSGVSISGFQVRGFSGLNIALVGAKDTDVRQNVLSDGGQYGFLADGSIDTRAMDNTVTATGPLLFIAMCTDNKKGVELAGNHLSGYHIGFCVQTSGSEIHHNFVSGVCNGAFVDPGVENVNFHHNYIGANDPRCANEWPFNVGILIDGAINAKVQFNTVEEQHAGGMAAGIALGDDPTTTPVAVASGNVISKNILRNNDLDLYVNTTGTGNVATNNQCSTSFPAGLCGSK